MPELPDLHTYAGNLRKLVLNKPILRAQVFNASKVSAPKVQFEKTFIGKRIVSIDRDGKELYFTLEGGAAFSVHLMLSGRFAVVPWAEMAMINSKIIGITFEDEQALVVSDYQRQCKVSLNPIRAAAPDVMSDDFTPALFSDIIKKNARMGIKELLVNQRLMRGIGNAYVDEILWRANVSPKSIAGKIPQEDLRAIYESIRWVMEDAIENIARISPNIIAGEERGFLRVHRPKQALAEDGETILCEEIDRRRTYFTKKQRLFI